ncbi:MAG: tetratricopeptide repeat protein [Luteolibacter sp.]
MSFRLLGPILLSATALLVCSCGNSDEVPLLAGNTQAHAAEGESLYAKAKAADDAGKTSSAIRQYNKVASDYPFAPSAAKARFRQAELLEQKGDVLQAFEAYQKFLTRFQGSGLYSTALNRQAKMAQDVADGDVKASFLGLKSRYSLEKTTEMLGKVRDNAPKSRTASRAQFTIGELNQGKKKSKEAIAAFRQLVRDQPESPEAPEALFRVGLIMLEEANRGNQNQANLDLAREAFNDYLTQYPGHSRNGEARKFLSSLKGMDLERSYHIAEFYQRTGKHEAAKVYYRDILKRSSSGKIHDDARARLKELGE